MIAYSNRALGVVGVFFLYLSLYGARVAPEVAINSLMFVDGYAHKVSSLMVAAAQGDSALVEQLLAEGANVDVQDPLGRTALFYVHDLATMQQLLKAYPNLCLQDKKGNTILHWTVAAGLSGYTIDNVTKAWSWEDMLVVVYMLIEQGANPNMQNKAKLIPLDLGLWKLGQEKLSLEWINSLVGILNKSGYAQMGPKTMKLFNAYIKDKEFKDVFVATFAPQGQCEKNCVLAAYTGGKNVVEQLICYVADINELVPLDIPKFAVPVNALMAATRAGNQEIVSLLLKHGASITTSDAHGANALVYARCCPEIMGLMLDMCTKKQAKCLSAAVPALIYESVEPEAIASLETYVSMLVQKGALVNTVYKGYTPLLATIRNGDQLGEHALSLTKLLLDAGADSAQTVEIDGVVTNAVDLASCMSNEQLREQLLAILMPQQIATESVVSGVQIEALANDIEQASAQLNMQNQDPVVIEAKEDTSAHCIATIGCLQTLIIRFNDIKQCMGVL